MHSVDQLASMDAAALRDLAASLLDKVSRLSSENRLKQLKIDQLTHEMAILKRWKFAARSEQLASEQKALFEETMDADLEAIGLELEALGGVQAKAEPKEQPRRTALPAHLPRREIRHEPVSRAGINRPGGVGIYRPGRRLPRSVPRGLRSVGHFAADFGARSGIFFGAGPTFGSR